MTAQGIRLRLSPMKTTSSSEGKHLIFPIFLPMRGCPGSCIYCDQYRISGAEADMGPEFDAAREFLRRHRGKARQIAFYGGSFTGLEEEQRELLLQPLLSELDEQSSFRISTHPLCINPNILHWCSANRITTIELGIQDFSSSVLSASGRGYDSGTAIKAARLVNEHGFELGVQLMPGLPGWDESSLALNHLMVKDIRPQLLRIYPCLVLKDTPLHELWRQGKYQPLSLTQAISQSADWQQLCDQEGIKLIKVGLPSNLDANEIAAGPWHPAFGELVRAELLVRSLTAIYPAGSIIKLDKKQRNLIMAHGGIYHNILLERIKNCSVGLS